MRSKQQTHKKLALDFTDAMVMPRVTSLALVAQAAHRLGLLNMLDGLVPCKRRDYGASDPDNVMALIGCLASGRGKLRDLDDVREDVVARRALGLERCAGSRRMGEWLGKLESVHVDSLQTMSRTVATRDGGLRPLIRDVVRTVGWLTKSSRKYTLQFTRRVRRQRMHWLVHACHVYDAW